jgi:hypothetical protein
MNTAMASTWRTLQCTHVSSGPWRRLIKSSNGLLRTRNPLRMIPERLCSCVEVPKLNAFKPQRNPPACIPHRDTTVVTALNRRCWDGSNERRSPRASTIRAAPSSIWRWAPSAMAERVGDLSLGTHSHGSFHWCGSPFRSRGDEAKREKRSRGTVLSCTTVPASHMIWIFRPCVLSVRRNKRVANTLPLAEYVVFPRPAVLRLAGSKSYHMREA